MEIKIGRIAVAVSLIVFFICGYNLVADLEGLEVAKIIASLFISVVCFFVSVIISPIFLWVLGYDVTVFEVLDMLFE
jgi:hypothetical protein